MNFLTSNRNVVIIAAAVIVLFAIVEVLDLRNQTFAGFSTDGNDTVTRVRPNSPAAQAGFAVGDRIVENGGIAVTDSKALSRRPRAAIGETRAYVVERAGGQQTLTLTFAGLPGRQMMLSLANLLIGLCFLIFGLWPYFKTRTQHTALLAVVGLCFALTFIGPPYFSSYALRTVVAVLFLPILILGFAVLLHFMLAFPRPKAWLEKKNAIRILYAPAVLFTLYVLFLVLVQPDATSVLNTVNNILFGLFFAGYLIATAVVMVRTYVKAHAEERTSFGLNVMVAGVVIGLLPLIIAVVVGIVAPKVVLPGSDFYGLTFILLPLSFAYAVMKAPEPADAAPATDVSADPMMA